jgi:hypothetical protein
MVPHLDGVQSAKQPLEQGFQRFHLPSSGEEQRTKNETSAGESIVFWLPFLPPPRPFSPSREREGAGL